MRTTTRAVLQAFLAISPVFATACGRPLCADREVQDSPSPDRSHRVVVVEVNCGAMSHFRFHVSIVGPSQSPRSALFGLRSVFEFVDVGRPQTAPPEPVRARWLSKDAVLVEYDPHVSVINQARESHGVRVLYHTW